MFIATKDTKVIAIHEVEWQCRRKAKGLDKSDYWTWLESVTTVTGTPPDAVETFDYSGEDYEIHEVDVDVVSLTKSGHIVTDLEGTHYHLSWDGSLVSADDDALATYQTAEKWKRVRADRNRKLAETDYFALNDQNLSAEMTTYRQALRDITTQSDPDNITWPEKP